MTVIVSANANASENKHMIRYFKQIFVFQNIKKYNISDFGFVCFFQDEGCLRLKC